MREDAEAKDAEDHIVTKFWFLTADEALQLWGIHLGPRQHQAALVMKDRRHDAQNRTSTEPEIGWL
jgi:hypothetical protein